MELVAERNALKPQLVWLAACGMLGALALARFFSLNLDGFALLPRSVALASLIGAAAAPLVLTAANRHEGVAVGLSLFNLLLLPSFQFLLLNGDFGGPWLQILPAVLGFPTLLLAAVKRSHAHPADFYLSILWLIINLPGLYASERIEQALPLYFVGVIVPCVVYLALRNRRHDEERGWLRLLALGCVLQLLLAGGILLIDLIFVTRWSLLAARNHSDLMTVIGRQFFVWPFLLTYFRGLGKLPFLAFIALMLTLTLVSLSRGLILVTVLILAFTFVRFELKSLLTTLAGVGLVVLTLAQLPGLRDSWGRRFNLVLIDDNPFQQTPLAQKFAVLLESDRTRIWGFAWDFAESSSFAGVGLGNFSAYMYRATNGVLSFAEAHSLLLTALAERGALATVFIVGIFFYLLVTTWLRSRNPTHPPRYDEFWPLAWAMVYACFVGLELLSSSLRFLDPTLSLFLAVIMVLVRRTAVDPKTAESRAQ